MRSVVNRIALVWARLPSSFRNVELAINALISRAIALGFEGFAKMAAFPQISRRLGMSPSTSAHPDRAASRTESPKGS
jgi:hypothetical protein